jgi:hypothetical protein
VRWRRLAALLSVLAAASLAPASSANARVAPASTRQGTGVLTQSTATESGSPIEDQGSNYNYRSYITHVVPKAPGLDLEVLEFADRILLRNHTGRTVTIYGYYGEPYARVQADGTAEENVRSPAVYLNTTFYANVNKIPPGANPNAPPKWVVIDRTGQFEWHDHRIHYTSPAIPPVVKDKSKRTLVFDWEVPISVGARKGAIHGQLYWVPENSKAPTGAIVAFVAIIALALIFVLVVRRHRGYDASRDGETAW